MRLINDRKYAAAMLILSLVYCVSALSLDADFNPVNEKFYPFVLSVLMILLSVGLMIWPSAQATTWPNWKNFQRIAITFIAILLYSLVLQKVGFIISAGLLMAICMWVFEADLKWIAPTSLIIVVSFYVVFDRMLGLNLPAGILGFL